MRSGSGTLHNLPRRKGVWVDRAVGFREKLDRVKVALKAVPLDNGPTKFQAMVQFSSSFFTVGLLSEASESYLQVKTEFSWVPRRCQGG